MPGDNELGPLAALAEAPERTGIFCDFDGCLSRIVASPPDARAVRGAPRVLAKLARRFAVVAVVSGRPASFLAHRLHTRRVHLVGLYGIEERVGRHLKVLSEARAARESIDRAAARLTERFASSDGIFVEHKGFAVAVHFRRAAVPEHALADAEPLVREIATSEGLAEVQRGRRVLEIKPDVDVDKGEVVRSLIERYGLTRGLVAGDDRGDLPSFAAVDGLEAAIRVAVASDEVPEELVARADRVVSGPEHFVRLLRKLARATAR